MNEILVSIWCLTYNHELYIRDAIEGFLAQKTSFGYEIIIHDDASTDKTAEIIREYEQKYPNLIRGIYQEENQFGKNQPSIEWILELEKQNCKGKYIALCEGDDYWIDAQKLQLQVDYLEAHPECIMTVHDTIDMDYKNYTVNSRSIFAKDCTIPPNMIIMQDILIPAASIMHRKELLLMDKPFLNMGIGDFPMELFALTKGEVYYFSRIMSVYRYRHQDSWTTTITEGQNLYFIHNILMINFLLFFNDYTNRVYEKFIMSKLQRHVDTVIVLPKCKKIETVFDFYEEYDELTHKKYHEIFERIERIYLQIFDENYLNMEVYNFAKKFKSIIIMGAGRYAEIVKKQLDKQEIEVKGFAVSDNQETKGRYLEKPVWKLKDIPFDIENMGIIIGINPVHWTEIVDALEGKKISNYICPFLL